MQNKLHLAISLTLTLSLSGIFQVVSAESDNSNNESIVNCHAFGRDVSGEDTNKLDYLPDKDMNYSQLKNLSKLSINYYDLGIIEIQENKLDKAISNFYSVIESYGGRTPSKRKISNTTFYSDPNEEYQQSNNSNNTNSSQKYIDDYLYFHTEALAYIRLGDLYAKKGELTKAFDNYQQAIMLDSRFTGYLYGITRNLNDVLPTSKQDIPINSKENQKKLFAAYIAKGYLYTRQQLWADAITNYYEAIKIDPSSAYPYIQLGYLYMSRMQSINISVDNRTDFIEQAQSYFRMARNIDNKNPFVSLALAKLYIIESNIEDLKSRIKNLINKKVPLDPDDKKTLPENAKYYAEKAVKDADKSPYNNLTRLSGFYYIEALAYRTFTGYDSIYLYKKAIYQDCSDPTPRLIYAQIYYQVQHDSRKTLSLIEKINKIDTTNLFNDIFKGDISQKNTDFSSVGSDNKIFQEIYNTYRYDICNSTPNNTFIATVPVPYYYEGEKESESLIITNPIAIANYRIGILKSIQFSRSKSEYEEVEKYIIPEIKAYEQAIFYDYTNNKLFQDQYKQALKIKNNTPITKNSLQTENLEQPVCHQQPVSRQQTENPQQPISHQQTENPQQPVSRQQTENPQQPVSHQQSYSQCSNTNDNDPYFKFLRSTVLINPDDKEIGTGWVVRKTKEFVYIMTNYHVIYKSKSQLKNFEVILFNNPNDKNMEFQDPNCVYKVNDSQDVVLLPDYDVAVIKLKSQVFPKDIKEFKIDYNNPISRLTKVEVIGHPASIANSHWIISQGYILNYDPNSKENQISFYSYVDKGNSGGPIIITQKDGKKKIIGIVANLANNFSSGNIFTPTGRGIKPIMCILKEKLSELNWKTSTEDCKNLKNK